MFIDDLLILTNIQYNTFTFGATSTAAIASIQGSSSLTIVEYTVGVNGDINDIPVDPSNNDDHYNQTDEKNFAHTNSMPYLFLINFIIFICSL